MKKPSFLKCRNSQLAPLFVLLAMTINAHADSATWNGADGTWATLGNWTGPPAAVPGTADTATFSSTQNFIGTAATPINNGGIVNVNRIVFDANALDYFLGGTINLSAGGGITVNKGNQTFGLTGGVASVNAAAGGTVTITGNSGTTTPISGAGPGITTTGGLTLAIDGKAPATGTTTVIFDGTGVTTTAAIQIASVVNTATSLTKIIKNGTGVLVLGASANDRIFGGFEINGGTVIANQQNALSNRGLTIGGGSTLQMNTGGQSSFNNALGNIVVNGDVNFHYNNTGNWGLGQTGVGAANTSQFSSTGSYVATFSVSTANQNGIRVSANNGGFTGTYKLGQNGALTFNGAARGSSSATLNMGDAGFGSHYFSTGVALQDLTTQAIQPIKFGALTGTDKDAVMSGRQNPTANTSGTQFEIGGLNTNTAYAGQIRDGSTAGLLLLTNGTAAGAAQAATDTLALSSYNRGAGTAGVPGTTELVKVGGGTLTLTGTNTHSGGTVIKGGTLAISSDAALGAAYDGSLRVFSYIPGGGIYTNSDLPDAALTGGGGSGASVNVYSTALNSNANGNLFLSFSSQANDSTAGAIVNTATGTGYTSVPTVSFTGGTFGTAGTGPIASVRVNGLLTLDGGTLQTDAGITTNRAVVIGAGNGTIKTQGFNSTFSGNINGSGNLSLVGGGTITLSSAVNSLTGTTTVGPNTSLSLTVALAGGVQVDATGKVGGPGLIGGALHLNDGAKLDVSGGFLSVAAGQSVSFGGFDFDDIVGFDVNTAPAGTYTLLAGNFTLDSTNIAHFGEANALDLGGGKSAYFSGGSLNVVVAAIPEPGVAILGSVGLLALLRRRRA